MSTEPREFNWRSTRGVLGSLGRSPNASVQALEFVISELKKRGEESWSLRPARGALKPSSSESRDRSSRKLSDRWCRSPSWAAMRRIGSSRWWLRDCVTAISLRRSSSATWRANCARTTSFSRRSSFRISDNSFSASLTTLVPAVGGGAACCLIPSYLLLGLRLPGFKPCGKSLSSSSSSSCSSSSFRPSSSYPVLFFLRTLFFLATVRLSACFR
mmetsp:Transcript_15488/g.25536  ORF Transcript_15488/g.25536 Transcript_15488/m.25536 type:complete len:215 (-) Transcript_15488:43-687(-)